MDERSWDIVVEGNDKRTKLDLKGLRKCRYLVFLLVRRTFVAQFKQTILGPAWAVIQPFFTTVVYSVFFGNIAGLGASGVPNFIFYLCATVIWTLFANCLTSTSDTFIGNSSILGKVYFPRLVMPISIALSQLISFVIVYGFMIIFLVFYTITGAGVAPNLYILLTPLVILQTTVLGMSFGMIVSALTTKYRDLKMVVSFGVTLWSYCSPVAYDMFSRASLMPGSRIYPLYMLNPMTPIVNFFRYAYLGTGEIDWLFYGISWGITIIVCFIGIRLFSKVEKNFMDTV